MRITLLDNFDSFTYNLVEQFCLLGAEVRVMRNDTPLPTIQAALLADGCELLVLSPGPGRPEDAGCMLELLAWARGRLGAPCPAASSRRNTSGPALRSAGGVPPRVRRRPRPGSPCPGRSAAAHCPRLWPASFPDLRSSSCPLPTMSAIVPGSGQALHGTEGFGRCEGGTRPLGVRRPKPYRRSR